MDKSKIIITFLFVIKVVSFGAFAQSPASNQSKYWFYRYRLTNEFLKKGEASCGSPSGFSIPASSGYKQAYDLHFGDGTSMVGFYISVLAMEHKLLRDHGGTDEQKNRTAQELYYAMKAYERVDKNAEKLKTDLTANNCENDLNGFFIRDDVPASPDMANAENPSTYLFDGKFKTSVRPFNFDPLLPNKIEYKLIHSDFAADLPNSNDPCKNKKSDGSRYPSQDQISDLLTGFALVETCMKETVGNATSSISYNGFVFADMAKTYTDKILSYLKTNNYYIKVPNANNDACTALYGDIQTRMNCYGIAKAGEAIKESTFGKDRSVNITTGGNYGTYQSGTTALFKSLWSNLYGYPNGKRIFEFNYSGDFYQIPVAPAGTTVSIIGKDSAGKGHDYNNALLAQFGAIGNSWKVGLEPFVALDRNIHVPWPCSKVNYTCFEKCMCCRRWCNWKQTICYPDGIQWWDCGSDVRFRVWCYNKPSTFMTTYISQLISQIKAELGMPLGAISAEISSFLTAVVPDIGLCAPINLPEITYNITALTLSEYGKMYKFDPYALLHKYLHNNGIYSYDKEQLKYYMNTAPCTGPHRYPYRDRHNPPNTNDWTQPSQSQGVKGWQADNRWQKANADQLWAKTESEAWSGLDYMFLYNLYYLVHGVNDGWPTYRDKLDVQLKDQTFNSNKTYIGYESLLCSNSTVQTASNVTFRAGNNIKLADGFKASAGSSFKATTNPVFTCSEIRDENTSFRLEEVPEPIPDTLVTQNVGQTIQNTLNSHVAAFKDSARKTVQQYKKYEPQADYIARKQTTASTRLAGIDLNLSPNPATHHITLSVSGNLDENYTWSIVNSMGITKQTGKTCCYDFYQNSETIDISSLLSGVYTLKLTSGSISQSVHFIKQ